MSAPSFPTSFNDAYLTSPFVAENSLHLVEMIQSKRLNVKKFHLGGTPRKVLFHSESRLLPVMRTDLSGLNEHVLVIGTSLSIGPAIMPSGEPESTKGRLIVLCLEHRQNSDSGSVNLGSRASSSSQRTSPFREIVGYAAEQLSSSSMCSSPHNDNNNCDGVSSWESALHYNCALLLAISVDLTYVSSWESATYSSFSTWEGC